MTLEEANIKIQDLEKRIKFFEDIFKGVNNNVQVQNTVRKMVIIGEHTTNKPKIQNDKGKIYKLQTV